MADEDENFEDTMNEIELTKAERLTAAKGSRRGVRTSTTKLISNIDDILRNDNSTAEELDDQLDLLRMREEALKRLDLQVKYFTDDEDELEADIDRVMKYQDDILLIKRKLERKIKKIRPLSDKTASEDGSVASGSSNSCCKSNNCGKSAVTKLPKLEMPTFSGDITDFKPFWSRFKVAVHDTEISKVEKLNYLLSYLTGEAKAAVVCYSATEEAYDEVVKLLTDRFGRTDLIVHSHMNKILNLEPVRKSSELKALRKLLETCDINLRSLKALKIDIASPASCLCPAILKSLPPDIRLEYSRTRENDTEWNAEGLIDFLRKELESRERSNLLGASIDSEKIEKFEPTSKSRFSKYESKNRDFKPRPASTQALATQIDQRTTYCIFCDNRKHQSLDCRFYTQEEKRNKVRDSNRCFNCLRKGHAGANCKSRFKTCKLCQGRHNHVVCDSNPANKGERDNRVSPVTEDSQGSVHASFVSSEPTVLLQTAQAIARNPNIIEYPEKLQVRCFLDGGSDATFVHEDISRKLNLPIVGETSVTINNFGNQNPTEAKRRKVRLTLENIKIGGGKIEIIAIEVPFLCHSVTTINSKEIEGLLQNKSLQLADDPRDSQSRSTSIGILIGSNYYWEFAYTDFHRITPSLVAQRTLFGWALQGPTNSTNRGVNACQATTLRVSVEEKKVADTLKSFWELESLGINPKLDETQGPNEIVEACKSTIKFTGTRYQINLPWTTDKSALSDNLGVAFKRFKGLTRKFNHDPIYFEDYQKVINDQLEQGIAEEVKTPAKLGAFYLPHQGVRREASSTTKLRVVFDASAHARGKPSLNDCLSSGINLNADLMTLLLRFRNHRIAITADLEKAFLKIELATEDRDSVRFLWVKLDKNNKILEDEFIVLRMTRVAFGLTCSPYLLAQTIKFHLEKYDASRPEIIALSDDLYVDDLVSGTDEVEDAFQLANNIRTVMDDAGMRMRKFNSNSRELRKLWGENTDHPSQPIILEGEVGANQTKVLGTEWDPDEDVLRFNLTKLSEILLNVEKTKRHVLSAVAQIFDPMGLLSPYTIRAKFMFQRLWSLKSSWDEPLPEEIRTEFNTWYAEMPEIRKISLPRCHFSGFEEITKKEIHCFCDASQRAYACVIYLRFETSSGRIGVSLATSKARVAPLSHDQEQPSEPPSSMKIKPPKLKLTLPRLELMACLLGARLVDRTKNEFNVKNIKIHMWTDSTIALHWVRGSSHEWKPFVSNRVKEIVQISDPKTWSHCPGIHNPADIPSRGTSVHELLTGRWFKGPEWLKLSESYWPKDPTANLKIEDVENERKKTPIVLVINCHEKPCLQNLIDLSKFSNLQKAVRIIAYAFRYCEVKLKRTDRSGPLTAEEINRAETKWIKTIQAIDYQEEIESLIKQSAVTQNSKIASLRPILNQDGVLCVGGRLDKSELTFEEKHPAIINKKSKLAELLIKRSHWEVAHSGVQSTFTQLRSRYWIPAGKQLTKKILKDCSVCKRYHSKPGQMVPAPLPNNRTDMVPPFSVIGLDFAGPLIVRTKTGSGKAYICLFTCAVTRSIHLELVESLSTQEFLMAFRRMVSRRGIPSVIYSDNAKTFRKADRDLKEIWKHVENKEVREYFGNKGISWIFIAERAAWWGGFWERLVRSTKTILRKTLGRASLYHQELATILTETEAVINSRPITYTFSEANEPEPITPAHYLIGKRITQLPSQRIKANPGETQTRQEFTKRMKNRQTLMDRLWKRWKHEYLMELRSAHHSKLVKREASMKVGDVVLIHEDKTPKHLWKMGVITETQIGRDGKIRSCIVRTPNNTHLRRPIQLLYALEISNLSA